MIRSFILIVCALALLLTTGVNAKDLPNGMGKNATLKLADRYYAESQFYSAIDNYKLYLQKKPADRYATYWLAMALYQARDYAHAADYFEKYYAIQPTKKDNAKKWEMQEKEYFKHGRLYYGLALHRTGKYEDAGKQLSLFRSGFQKQDDKEFETLTALAKAASTGCDSAALFPKEKIKLKTLSADINNPYTQAAPFQANESELYYTSLPESKLVKYEDYKNKKYSYIYKSTLENGEWTKGKKLAPTINEENYFTGNGTFNADRNRFYFTKCLERDDDRSLCNIFVADVRNGKIGEPTRLPANINFEEKYTSTHPAVRSLDSKNEIVYFVTDRPGGKGGLDIWYTRRDKKGEYSIPQPMVGNVNTPGDEVTPFFDDSTKTLFFSSDGHPGLGGYDIFKSTFNPDDNTWSNPTNIGKPINSGADELYYTRTHDQTNGFFTSNRVGSAPLANIETASDDIYFWENLHFGVEGTIKENGLEATDMTGSVFSLYRKLPNGERELVAVDSSRNKGSYFFKLNPEETYEVEATKDGFLPKMEVISTVGLEKEDTFKQKIEVDKDSYVSFGKILADDSLSTSGIKGATVLIYDVIGGKEELIKEMVVDDSTYALRIPTGRDYKIMARKEGFFASAIGMSTKGLGNKIDSVKGNIKLKRVKINIDYKLDNILYDYDKSTLTKDSKMVLDSLYTLLHDNPSFEIELSSHTDGKGNPAYNLKLSQARAQSCVDYLIKKGIAKKRMKPKGYGMSKPVAPNTKTDGTDDAEGRALNRRTEFRILKS